MCFIFSKKNSPTGAICAHCAHTAYSQLRSTRYLIADIYRRMSGLISNMAERGGFLLFSYFIDSKYVIYEKQVKITQKSPQNLWQLWNVDA